MRTAIIHPFRSVLRSGAVLVSLFVFTFGLAPAFGQLNLSNEDLIKLAKAGLSDDFVIGQINQSGATLQSDPASLIALKNAGVSDKLIAAVVRKAPPREPITSDSVLRLGAAGFSDSFIYGLVSDSTGRYATDASRLVELKKAGISDRVLAVMVRKSPPLEPLTADSVLRLKQGGFSDEFVLDLIKQVPTRFTLSATRIVELKEAGVSERVLSAMLGKTGGEIPAGTQVSVRLIDAIDSSKASTGDTFHASLAEALVVNGREVAPRGADAMLVLKEEKEAGKLTGRAELTIALQSITIQGAPVKVETSVVERESGSQTKTTATRAGVVAGIGAAIGAIAGGGKGAAIGAGAGAAAGAGSVLITKGQQVKIPSETILSFALTTAATY